MSFLFVILDIWLLIKTQLQCSVLYLILSLSRIFELKTKASFTILLNNEMTNIHFKNFLTPSRSTNRKNTKKNWQEESPENRHNFSLFSIPTFLHISSQLQAWAKANRIFESEKGAQRRRFYGISSLVCIWWYRSIRNPSFKLRVKYFVPSYMYVECI